MIANVLLFIPFGAALFLRNRRIGRNVLFGALLSAGIELAQFRIPGRDPSLRDLLFDSLGTWLGVLLTLAWPVWRTPARRWLPPSVAVFAALGIMVGGILLFAPAFPKGPLVASWSPTRASHLYPYAGQVLSTGVGNLVIAPGPVQSPELLRSQLQSGAVTRATVIAGTLPRGLSPLFMLLDSAGGEVLLLGIDRSELVFRFRMRAAVVGLNAPDLRLAIPIKGLQPGSSFHARAWRWERGFCLSLNRTIDCSLGFTLGDTWTVLFYPRPLRSEETLPIQLLWVGALFVPAGFLTRRSLDALVVFAPAVAMLVALPRLLHCAPTPAWQVIAALAGALLGMTLAHWRPADRAMSG